MNARPYESENPRPVHRVDEPDDGERQDATARAAPAGEDDQPSDEMPDEPGYGHGV